MTLSKRDRRALILGSCGLAILLIVRFAVMPWTDHWLDVRDQTAVARAEIAHLEQKVTKIVLQRARTAKAYGPGANRKVGDVETERMNLLKAVQKVCQTAGFAPTDYPPQVTRPLRSVPDMVIVRIQLQGKCKLPQLVKCLAGLRKAETLVFAERVTAVNSAKKPGELDITLVLATLAERKEKRS